MISKKPKYNIDFVIDLRRVDGPGIFPCPECGVEIDPDDRSENTYEIVGTRTYRNQLASTTIQHNCGTRIKLTGSSAKPLERHQEITV